jgi:hypothetical protein
MPLSVGDPLDTLNGIPGGKDLLDLFGGVPNFGDSEILEIYLHRKEPSRLQVHHPGKNVILTFTMTDVFSLKLEDFNAQNVLGSLKLNLIRSEPETFGLRWLHKPQPHFHYELMLEAVDGLGGFIKARHICIDLAQAQPASA